MRKALGLVLALALTLAAGCAGKPSQPPEPAPAQQITNADFGKTIEMHPGDTFALVLGGPPPDWEVQIQDQNVLARVPNIMPVKGSQGVFRAHQPGTTELTATGTYPCQRETPACKIASPFFRITVTVKP